MICLESRSERTMIYNRETPRPSKQSMAQLESIYQTMLPSQICNNAWIATLLQNQQRRNPDSWWCKQFQSTTLTREAWCTILAFNVLSGII